MKKIRYTGLIILLILFFSTESISQSLYIKHYTINDGLAGNHTYKIHQDKKGYIWICTTAGLSRFDGESFKNYNFKDGLLDNEVINVSNDASNNIWVSTFTKQHYISRLRNNFDKDGFQSIPYNWDDKQNNTPPYSLHFNRSIYSYKNDVCYFFGKYAILYVSPDGQLSLVSKYINEPRNVHLFETQNGEIYSYDGKELWKINDSVITNRIDINLYGKYRDLSFYRNVLYIAKGNEIVVYKYSNNSFQLYKTIELAKDINLIHVNQYGIWVSYVHQKGCVLIKRITSGNSIRNIDVNCYLNNISEDNEGGMWLSSQDNGIYYIPNVDAKNYTEKNGLASSVVYSITPSSKNTLWLGYNIGKAEELIIENDIVHKKSSLNLLPNNSTNNFVIDIVEHKEATYFLSRSNLAILKKGQLTINRSIYSNKSFLILNDSIFYVGSIPYKVYTNNTVTKGFYSTNRIYTQAIDTVLGLVWLGGINGLYCYKPETMDKPKLIKELEGVRINKLLLEGKYIWIGTHNRGLMLAKYDTSGVKIIKPDFDKISQSSITAIAKESNQLWVGSNSGVWHGKFEYSKLSFSTLNLINHNDGLISPEINDIAIKNEKVYLATYGGLIVLEDINPKKLHYELGDKYVRSLNSGDVIRNDNISIPYSVKGIEIGMRASALRYKDEITYEYMLYPFDKEWSANQSGRIKYTNIPPGEYEFRVNVMDNHGNSTMYNNALHLTIAPLFWQTIYYKIAIIVMIIMIISSGVYLYFRIAQKRAVKELATHRLIAKAKLEALKAQLKPHFIFNCLNALNDYIFHHKNNQAAELLNRFSTFIRKGLELADDDFITIEEEVKFLKNYLDIEQTKCENCFKYTIDVPKNIEGFIIPTLITQPFVENAIVHGVSTANENEASLNISYSLVGKNIVCNIVDNGIGISESLSRKSVYRTKPKGTYITKERVEYFKSGMDINIELKVTDLKDIDDNLSGTQVSIIMENAANFVNNEN